MLPFDLGFACLNSNPVPRGGLYWLDCARLAAYAVQQVGHPQLTDSARTRLCNSKGKSQVLAKVVSQATGSDAINTGVRPCVVVVEKELRLVVNRSEGGNVRYVCTPYMSAY